MPQIRTFCRIKPTADYYPEFEVTHDTLSLRVPELLRDYNNSKANNRTSIHHEFHFNYIFKNIATQEEVFDVAAKDIVAGNYVSPHSHFSVGDKLFLSCPSVRPLLKFVPATTPTLTL